MGVICIMEALLLLLLWSLLTVIVIRKWLRVCAQKSVQGKMRTF